MYIFLAVFVHELTHARCRPFSVYLTHYVCAASGPGSSLTFDNSDSFALCFFDRPQLCPQHMFKLARNNTKYLQTSVSVALLSPPRVSSPTCACLQNSLPCHISSRHGCKLAFLLGKGILSGNSSLCQQRRLLPLIDTN